MTLPLRKAPDHPTCVVLQSWCLQVSSKIRFDLGCQDKTKGNPVQTNTHTNVFLSSQHSGGKICCIELLRIQDLVGFPRQRFFPKNVFFLDRCKRMQKDATSTEPGIHVVELQQIPKMDQNGSTCHFSKQLLPESRASKEIQELAEDFFSDFAPAKRLGAMKNSEKRRMVQGL